MTYYWREFCNLTIGLHVGISTWGIIIKGNNIIVLEPNCRSMHELNMFDAQGLQSVRCFVSKNVFPFPLGKKIIFLGVALFSEFYAIKDQYTVMYCHLTSN